jgi:phosphatidylglycerol:prolipoprotein diacylglycerol transferase
VRPWGPVHPTQLYESAFLFYLSFALTIIDRGKKFEGQTLASYGLIYALFRFIVEFWRGDVPRYNHLTVAQWTSVVLFPLCWWWLTRQRKRWAMAKREEILAQVEQLKRQQAGGSKSQPAKARKKRAK